MATPIPENVAAFTLREILATTGGTSDAPAGLSVVGVSTDTRALREGQLFVALSGERFDGHEHLAAAEAAGAALALVEREVATGGLPTVRVSSTLDALGMLAATHVERWRRAHGGRVIALTGSAGKTTTKGAIGALAELVFPGAVLVTEGNLNNRVGVPMTALGLGAEHRLAVLELGTNEPGEIAKLARMVRPDIGLVTLIAAAHTEGLGGIEGVAKEKAALFEELSSESGVAIGNADDPRVVAALMRVSVRHRITYGVAPAASYGIRQRTLRTPNASWLLVDGPRGPLELVTPLAGAAGALATVAALAAVDALGERALGRVEIESALASAAAQTAGRLRPRELASGLWLIDDSYNANPASCRSSITTAREVAAALGRRLVLVLGEMRELGPASAAEHRALGADATEPGELVVAVGGDARYLGAAAAERGVEAIFAGDSEEAADIVSARVLPSDVVLVKGSRGVRTERVVEALEREHDAVISPRDPSAKNGDGVPAGGAA